MNELGNLLYGGGWPGRPAVSIPGVFVLSAWGGFIGLSVGFTGTGVLLVSVALAAGVLFGAYPAYLASGLALIEALQRQ